jgi:hypothetical protein
MHSLKLLGIALGIASQSLLPLAAAGADLPCERSKVNVALNWISSLEYDALAHQILIADPGDPKRRQLIAYDPIAGKSEPLQFNDSSPSSLTKVQGGFLLKEGDVFTFLDEKRQFLGKANLRATKSGSSTGLDSLYSNWVTRNSRFVGFGSAKGLSADPDQPFQLGFVTGRITANSDQPRDVRLLEKMPEPKTLGARENADLYLLGFPYFAANDLGLFYLRMLGTTASIVRLVEQGNGTVFPAPLSVFPKDFVKIPELPKLHEMKSPAAERFGEIEKSKLAVGLFGQDKYLYVLTRENPTGASTRWMLHQIDSEKSVLRGAMILPTNASFLSIAVTPDNWYIFERGNVLGFGKQDIKTLVRIPSARIAALSARLSSDAPVSLSCNSKAVGVPGASSEP